ncbi:MAG: AI-2E family transporter [Variibacter sp.]
MLRTSPPTASKNGNRPSAKANENGKPQEFLPANWRDATDGAIIGIFVILAVAALYLSRSVVMPVSAALIVGITLSPVQKYAEKYKVPPILPAMVLVALFCGAVWLAVVLSAGPLTEWIGRAPELADTLKNKLRLLERPLAMLHTLRQSMGGDGKEGGIAIDLAAIAQGALSVATPALTELLVFFGTLLFFLVGVTGIRRKLIVKAGSREARLRVVRIWGEIEQNLITYVVTVSVINVGLGAVTAAMLYAIGFPNPIAFGILTAALNYIPYIGAAVMVAILFVVGLVVSSTLGGALLAPALFVAIATVEGQIVTPSIVGHRLTMSPFAVFLSLAFWAWLWGPLGAFLAAPMLIVGMVIVNHLSIEEEAVLPK